MDFTIERQLTQFEKSELCPEYLSHSPMPESRSLTPSDEVLLSDALSCISMTTEV